MEAISNTTPVFKEPRDKNAALTMLWMGGLAVVMFLGLTWLANQFGISQHLDQTQPDYQSVVGQVANIAWPPALHFMFFVVQYATAAVLVIAANAAFAGFPQLTSMLARDNFLPRQLANIGDRLSYSNGIVLLAAAACVLIYIFQGIVNNLLNLYAIGVFTSFTIAQIGMVRHWLRERERGWQGKLFFNALGAAATGVVTAIIAVSKFDDGDVISPTSTSASYQPHYGTWLVVVLVPLMVTDVPEDQPALRRPAPGTVAGPAAARRAGGQRRAGAGAAPAPGHPGRPQLRPPGQRGRARRSTSRPTRTTRPTSSATGSSGPATSPWSSWSRPSAP